MPNEGAPHRNDEGFTHPYPRSGAGDGRTGRTHDPRGYSERGWSTTCTARGAERYAPTRPERVATRSGINVPYNDVLISVIEHDEHICFVQKLIMSGNKVHNLQRHCHCYYQKRTWF